MKHTELLQALGLARNEAILYEALLQQETSISRLSEITGIHRRNVRDSLNRLLEKGLALQIVQDREFAYRAIEPDKLREELSQRQHELEQALPHLQKLYQTKPQAEEVYVLRGIEGWKTYMRQILNTSEDVYSFGAKGQWNKDVLGSFFTDFVKEAKKRQILFKIIYDVGVPRQVGNELGAEFRFLPKTYATSSAIVVFGDHTVLLSHPRETGAKQLDVLTVIVNQAIAESFRTWWRVLWESAKV